MIIPQPFQYQGSKRSLATKILSYLPVHIDRFVEPFAGSGALSLACAARQRSRSFWLNDINKPLIQLLDIIVNQPKEIADFYESIWRDKDADHLQQFYLLREEFNKHGDPKLLLYLLARCVKGSIRYNRDGQFNQSPDKRRLGTMPSRMRSNIHVVSMLLRGKTKFSASDFREVLGNVTAQDVVYMDPPYQGVCTTRDQRYSSGIESSEFIAALEKLNRNEIRYLVSYDGRLGDKSYGEPLPESLDLVLVEIEAGRSSQATLLGQDSVTVESLYLSRSLAKEVGAIEGFVHHHRANQMYLLEKPSTYAAVS